MAISNIKTPGVYINEINAFPDAVVPVATAVPAFIGYTPQAAYEGKSYINTAQKITSFTEFRAIYCYPDPPPPASPAKQYEPQYYFVPQKSQPVKGDYMFINGIYYSILPDPATIYYLYNSIRLFYANGGGDAYIVSVGTYGAPSKTAPRAGDQLINPNVQLSDLLNGLALLKNEQEPTMYICPEATLLSVDDNGKLMQAMLLQSSEMKTAISIFDCIGGKDPDPILYTNDISSFRNNTGEFNLNYGTAYYPFIGTTIMQANEIDYTNLFGGDIKQLAPLINPPDHPNQKVAAILAAIEKPSGSGSTVTQNNNALIAASEVYSAMLKHVLADANILPASGGMAGVITMTDKNTGPWRSPANVSIAGAVSLPIQLSDSQQGNLDMPLSGKSINAIRFFNSLGILVWGARTLDANSLDWRYIPVRRTVIFIEQSCKLAAQVYVFEPNDGNTWAAVKAIISSFLTSIWKQGGLLGSSAADAFSVECGFGIPMTAGDKLNSFMSITIKVAVAHPAEFIVISFQQQMGVSG